jgi:hypothetical protein
MYAKLHDRTATFEPKPATDVDIDAFVAALNAKWPEHGPYCWDKEAGARKYVRVYNARHGQRMCWGFVERATGFILKSGGWVGPQKDKSGFTPRGTIHAEDHGVQYVEWTGPRYLK